MLSANTSHYLLLSFITSYYLLLSGTACYHLPLSQIERACPHTKRSIPTHPRLQEDTQMTKCWPRQLFFKLLTGNLHANLRATTQHEVHSRSSGTSESQHVRACGGYAFRQFQTIPDHFEEANKKNINNSEFESFTPIPLWAWLGTCQSKYLRQGLNYSSF